MRLTVRFHNGGWFTADLIDDHDLRTVEWLRGQWRAGARGPLRVDVINASFEMVYEDIADVTIEAAS